MGDIADSGAHKAARPGVGQAQVVAKNVLAMVEGREPSDHIAVGSAGIHLTLGLVSFILFRFHLSLPMMMTSDEIGCEMV